MTERQAEKRTFATEDGAELCYRHWPAQGERRGALVLLHRGHEHSGRMAHLAEEFDLPAFSVFAWDARGHGESPGPRGYSPGAATSVRDLHSFIAHLTETHGIATEDIVIVAQSIGATVAAAWVHDHAPPIRAMVLAAPAFEVKLYVPFALTGLRLAHKLRGDFFVNSYVKARLLTHDPARIADYENDPLISRAISVGQLLDLHDLGTRVVADAAAITVPTQVLISGADWVVREAPQQRFFERLGAMRKEVHVLDGFFHDTLGEQDRHIAIGKARRFILGCFDVPAAEPCLLDADRRGAFKKEADRLARPLPLLSFQGLYWRAVQLALRAGARLSEGVRIGRETGFDSGSMLDYVYRNRPQGCGPLGRLIDRKYLDAIGWKGIRQRKSNLKALLSAAMERSRQDGLPLHVLDIAAGHGRYVLEAIEGAGARPESVLLRDYSDRNVAEGTALIAQKGLAGIAAFEQGDAFDREELARVAPRPSVAVVSGLYELFPENHLVRRSLDGVAAALRPGGYLVYTNQPWHPQLEFIARALTSHRQGRAWVMRRRSQAEMDQLVAAAGFEKIAQRIDPWGIFTVSLARKTPLGSLARKAPAAALARQASAGA
ncbi:bifunctional alpha/beta hydrolase/class I SAM-dependent methyltransferase [Pelagibius sp.]|uniref:bifunctional alpha/beta hydrolase/class I SAM-dependent methyltransferase n=1 Tax=Pelagibius sp. TaxID=1931238 RepID=UPI0026059D25|nr:bifunctional alpha/beta hydrolase/class I SAM-dependent methyltransferase [Pelagibius sp.]